VPLWSNPCLDERHGRILPAALNCSNIVFPNTLIVGPQKTGSTALGLFLSLHSEAQMNRPVPGSFEELQFFGGANYALGIEWYTKQFDLGDVAASKSVIFEKSATYFDSVDAPRMVHALLPDVRIVVICTEPGDRAYSWYQHMKAHNDSTAQSVTFDELLASTTGLTGRLRARAITAGRYAHHLERWLEMFPSKQIYIMDGEFLKQKPHLAMEKLQRFLQMSPIDYSQLLKFNPKKGFYCAVVSGQEKCLGISKGRQYEAMSSTARTLLHASFHADNLALHKLIVKNGWQTPDWLRSHLAAI